MYRWKVVRAICCSLVLAGCGVVGTGDEAAARKAVLKVLKDPDSAKFGQFKLAGPEGPTGKQGACLVVNAKNSMGGYTGDQSAMLFRAKRDGEWEVFGMESETTCQILMNQRKDDARSD